MHSLLHWTDVHPWENNASSSLSVMEALALCAMHFLRQRSKLSDRVCVCVCTSKLGKNQHESAVIPAMTESVQLLYEYIRFGFLYLCFTRKCDHIWGLERRRAGEWWDIDQDRNCLLARLSNQHLWLIWVEQRQSSKMVSWPSSQPGSSVNCTLLVNRS